MSKAYRLLLALCATAATLSSCSRANYSFNPATPAYLGSQPAHASVARPVPAATPAAEVAAPAVATPGVVVAPATRVETLVATRAEKKAARHAHVAVATEAAAPALATTAPAKPTLVQRMVMNKISKKLAKAESRNQNAAGVTHTTAAGPGVTVSIIGLIALLVGIIAGSGLVITLGAIVLVVGLVILLLGAL